MRAVATSFLSLILFAAICTGCPKVQPSGASLTDALKEVVEHSSLTEPGSPPFYLKARIINSKDPDWPYNAELEEYWVSPTRWRRSIRSQAFSQVLIVNGDKRSEQDTGDYFPPSLEELAISLVDPIPASVLDQFDRLNMQIGKPADKPGQCMADTQFHDAHGDQNRAVVAVDCQNGLLLYAGLPGWNVGVFADYKHFHNKSVARRTKDNEVNAQVEELRNLEGADETLFVIQTPSSTKDQIQTVLVPGDEYRAMAMNPPEIHWPQVSNPPETGTVLVSLIADRGGHVREAVSYVSSNNDLREFAVEQVKNWRFKPYLVNGAPVQVHSTLALEFKAELKPDPAPKPFAKDYFDRARQVGSLRLENSHSFHLKASFEAMGNTEMTGKGTYEETWISPTQWRRDATLDGLTVSEARNGMMFYRKFKGPYAPRRVDEALDALTIGLAGDNGAGYDENDWHVAKSQLGNVPLVRVSKGYINDQGKPDPHTTIFYFDPNNGLLRDYYGMMTNTTFNDFLLFEGKNVAHRISVTENGVKVLEATIDVLEPPQSQTSDIFTLEGASRWSGEEATSGSITPPQVIKQIMPTYPEGALNRNIHQTIICEVLIDRHGHVRAVTFSGDSDEMLEQAIRDATMQWEFKPGSFEGVPVAVPQKLQFQF